MNSFRQSLIFVLVLFSGLVKAQRICGTVSLVEQELLGNSQYKDRMKQAEAQAEIYQSHISSDALGVLTIPVVFHIVYNSGSPEQNISDERIHSQLDILNEDFRRQNADANSTWPQADDVEIQFIMAPTDPNGQPTTGITRTVTTRTSFGNSNDMKIDGIGKAGWDHTRYLNIWVCNLSGGLLGFAYYPGVNDYRDGVVITYWATGLAGASSQPFHLGRTATHEVGHYLNLIHIWGDGGCGIDDEVADTPVSDGPNFGCAIGVISCGTEDMVANYMDYSDDACMNLFTTGQKSRMRSLFQPGGLRESLPLTDLTYRFIGPGIDWNTSSNWQGGLIPPPSYTGQIYIDSDCVKPAGIEIIPPKQIVVASGIYFQVNGN